MKAYIDEKIPKELQPIYSREISLIRGAWEAACRHRDRKAAESAETSPLAS